MSQTARLSTKGQLVLPKALRERHGWHAGTELEIEDRRDGVLVRSVERLPATRLADLVGCAGYDGPPVSLDEMAAAIEREAKKHR